MASAEATAEASAATAIESLKCRWSLAIVCFTIRFTIRFVCFTIRFTIIIISPARGQKYDLFAYIGQGPNSIKLAIRFTIIFYDPIYDYKFDSDYNYNLPPRAR